MTEGNWAPSRIWLQRGVGEEGSHTWCEDSIDDCEQAEYVRVDAINAMENSQIREIWLRETGTTEQDSPLAILDFAYAILRAATEAK